ncbi:MAG TPA: SDR family oxidoreductase [Gaiellaceae bacterium]|nr:SDR family oxidoreductase [Gaiellaceae bacterium]
MTAPTPSDGSVTDLFGLAGRVAVVTGATGVLGGELARGLAAAGASVGVLARRGDRVEALVEELRAQGREALALEADVLDAAALERARDAVLGRWSRVDVLVNAAGGNVAAATTGERSFFELPAAALEQVVALNLHGTILSSQVFGAAMARLGDAPPGGRSIVNVSSMAARRALTRVGGYGAAKAAVENLTRWLAVELAPARIRVNAVAPGFFASEQNRTLLYDRDGTLSGRGARIVAGTPAGRFGEPRELVGAVVWLAGDSASFVTGAVIPVDGGFDAFSGV